VNKPLSQRLARRAVTWITRSSWLLHPFIGGAGTLAAIGRKAIANNRGDDV